MYLFVITFTFVILSSDTSHKKSYDDLQQAFSPGKEEGGEKYLVINGMLTSCIGFQLRVMKDNKNIAYQLLLLFIMFSFVSLLLHKE